MSPAKRAPARKSAKASQKGSRKRATKSTKPPAKKAAKKGVKKGSAKTAAASSKALSRSSKAMKAPPRPPSPNTVFIEGITAGMPFLRKGVPAEMFVALREKVKREAGFDFLNLFGDMMRPRNLAATPGSGVAQNSRHKCGDAFDYNQGHTSLALVTEPREGRMYWRTFLLCAKQDGSQGESLRISNGQILAPVQGGAPKFYYDFTMAAEALGWHRIPAHPNWQAKWKRREYWHYQNIEGYTFDEAMTILYGNAALVPPRPRFPTVNPGQKDDTGVNVLKDVRQIQAQLYLLKLLAPRTEVDGVYGGKTETAVRTFQQKEGLPVTGIADGATRKRLLERVM